MQCEGRFRVTTEPKLDAHVPALSQNLLFCRVPVGFIHSKNQSFGAEGARGFWGFEPQSDLFLRLLGGSWVVISRIMSPLIWVIGIVILLITLVITTHEPPSFSRCPRRPESIPKTPGRKDGISQVRVKNDPVVTNYRNLSNVKFIQVYPKGPCTQIVYTLPLE